MNAAAQITINLPKFPKIKKTKVEPTTQETTNTNSQQTQTTTEQPYKEVDARISLFLDDVKATRNDIESYTYATRTSLVSGKNYDWLLRAISPSERKEFFDKWGSLMSPEIRTTFVTELDAINAAALIKAPQHIASNKTFMVRNPAEEKLMKAEMSDVPGLVVYKIGLAAATWKIGTNDYGIPQNRFKYGMIWGRNPDSDHPFCRFWYVNIIQDYAGAGTYGASYAKYVDTEIAGCPAK
jgi:hypothetical protein